MKNSKRVLLAVFDRLLKSYGPRKWWPAKTRFEVIAGAILTQNVTWKNAKQSIEALQSAGLLNHAAILKARHDTIAAKIKSSRYYNQKTLKLKNFCSYLVDSYNGSLNKLFSQDLDKLRHELLSIKGIGKETADSILLYAGKKLSFVSDSYTKRFLTRYGIIDETAQYDDIRDFFMTNLPGDLYLYNEYHALIVHHGYLTCKSKPGCSSCPIQKLNSEVYCKFSNAANKI
ncbi:MAG: endonuclease III domain-containing protein [Elusimicrobiota bacterium]